MGTSNIRPIDFVVFGGDSTPNMPARLVAEAMMEPLIVVTPDGDGYRERTVVGYYCERGRMVLELL